MKYFLNIILLALISVQMLPVKEIGKALYECRFVEEVNHTLDHENNAKKNISKSEYLDFLVDYAEGICILNSTQNIFCNVNIPCNFSSEILVPPPNC